MNIEKVLDPNRSLFGKHNPVNMFLYHSITTRFVRSLSSPPSFQSQQRPHRTLRRRPLSSSGVARRFAQPQHLVFLEFSVFFGLSFLPQFWIFLNLGHNGRHRMVCVSNCLKYLSTSIANRF